MESVPDYFQPWGHSFASQNLVISILLVLCLSVFARYVTVWYRLRHIPGPFICKFSTIWLARKCLSGRVNEDFKRLAENYGMLASFYLVFSPYLCIKLNPWAQDHS